MRTHRSWEPKIGGNTAIKGNVMQAPQIFQPLLQKYVLLPAWMSQKTKSKGKEPQLKQKFEVEGNILQTSQPNHLHIKKHVVVPTPNSQIISRKTKEPELKQKFEIEGNILQTSQPNHLHIKKHVVVPTPNSQIISRKTKDPQVSVEGAYRGHELQIPQKHHSPDSKHGAITDSLCQSTATKEEISLNTQDRQVSYEGACRGGELQIPQIHQSVDKKHIAVTDSLCQPTTAKEDTSLNIQVPLTDVVGGGQDEFGVPSTSKQHDGSSRIPKHSVLKKDYEIERNNTPGGCVVQESVVPGPSDKHPGWVPPHLITLNLTTKEVEKRMNAYLAHKRTESNIKNIEEFCLNIGKNPNVCSRVDEIPYKHKRRKRDKFDFNPKSMDEEAEERRKSYLSLLDSQGNLPLLVTHPALEERIAMTENHLKIGGPVPKDIYKRIKRIEDRILFLEGVSPEYAYDAQGSVPPVTLLPRIKKRCTVEELDSKIAELKKKLDKAAPSTSQKTEEDATDGK